MDVVDLIVLGLGPGGEAVAHAAARAGRRVVGIDPGLVGGECPYYGCIPSKMMLRAAETLVEAERVNALAGTARPRSDFTPVADRIRDEATDDWDDTVAVERFEHLGGTFVRGPGRILGRHDDGNLIVSCAGETWRAPDVVVATGTRPALPPIDGLAELHDTGDGVDGPVWTNREVFKARTVPGSLVVLGGGAIGCELAQGFARFGAAVTLVEAASRILAVEEPDTSETITDVFTGSGITVRTEADVQRVATTPDGRVRLELGDGGTVTAHRLLVAAGRHAVIDDIGLQTVGLDPPPRRLEVDDDMSVLDADGHVIDGLHAVGDITGRGAFTHVAAWQARVLSGRLLDRDAPFGGYHGLAWVTFVDPEVGRVGMTEAQAREAGVDVRVARSEMLSNTRGWIHGAGNDGFVKLVVDAGSDTLVGATVVAPNGGEILGLLTLAVHARVPVATLATMHFVFPTMHRAVLEAIDALA